MASHPSAPRSHESHMLDVANGIWEREKAEGRDAIWGTNAPVATTRQQVIDSEYVHFSLEWLCGRATGCKIGVRRLLAQTGMIVSSCKAPIETSNLACLRALLYLHFRVVADGGHDRYVEPPVITRERKLVAAHIPTVSSQRSVDLDIR